MRIKVVMSSILLVMLSMGLQSCEKKNDSDSIYCHITNCGYLNNAGLRVASSSSETGNHYFYYADNGMIDCVVRSRKGGDEKFVFNATGDKITYTYGEKEGLYSLIFDVSDNLTGVNYSIQKGNDEKERGGISFTYDETGHLETITSSVRLSDELFAISLTLLWKNNLVCQIKYDATEMDHVGYNDEEMARYNGTMSFSYDNPVFVNTYKQLTPIIFTSFKGYGIEWDIFSCLGLLGEGPELLPSSAKIEYEKYESTNHESDTFFDVFQYLFLNNNGPILHCSFADDSCYSFTYGYGKNRS